MMTTNENDHTLQPFNGWHFILACLQGSQVRRRWLANWLALPTPRFAVRVKQNIRVPMSDGVMLLTDHYFPRAAGSYPTILIRSIWGRQWHDFPSGPLYIFIAQRFAEQGYHVLIQSVRSKPAGDFLPDNESADGRATLDWIAEQPWFNGSLGMWGLSYLGNMQWAVAKDAPPFLKALVPAFTTSWMRSLFYQEDVFSLDSILTVLSLMSSMNQPIWRIFLGNRDQPKRLLAATMHLPLNEADTVVTSRPSTSYREALQHSDQSDPYWHTIDFRAGLASISIPVHLISGWYDIFLHDLLDDYTRLLQAGNIPYLTIGPWGHLSAEAGFACVREALRWYDTHLKHASQAREHPVRIYVMGSNRWQEMEHWPPTTQEQQYYLHALKQLSMQVAQEDEEPDHYVYDPADPTPAPGGTIVSFDAGQQDNRALGERTDVLCYTTEPLESDLTIMGTIRLTLYVHSSAHHTDFFGRVCDVSPENKSLNVCDGLLRLKPDDGELQTDGNRRIELKLWPTAYCFSTGHRLRLLVASGAHPRWARNPGTGEDPAIATKMIKAEQTIYHDTKHASMLMLPALSCSLR